MLRQNIGVASPIVIASSDYLPIDIAVADLRRQLGGGDYSFALAFFSPEIDANDLAQCLKVALDPVPFAGCSTAGEITPDGVTTGKIVVIAFRKSHFRIESRLLFEDGPRTIGAYQEAAQQLACSFGRNPQIPSAENDFALLLVDGLSNEEEKLVSAIGSVLMDIPLVGGSAGDGLQFRETRIIHNGSSYRSAAIMIMVRSSSPFAIFKADHFDPTPVKLVVTKADVERRIVQEINAAPAAQEFAAAVGLVNDELSPMSFAGHPVVVRVGGDYYVRSIQKMNLDGSLTFFCAIDEGIVLTLAKCNDMVQQTENTLDRIMSDIGGPVSVIAFECVLRRLEMQIYQNKRRVEEIYKRFNVAGFFTYGEQFNAMHLNHTFTGVAIGH